MIGLLNYPWWVLLFFAIGIVAIASAIVTLFFSVGRRPDDIWMTEVPPVGSEAFLLGISGTVNASLLGGGTARAFNNGIEIFPALLEAIRGARRTINFMVYIWQPGRASDMIFDALTERAHAGVEVRVMFDGMGAMQAPRDRIAELEAAGGKTSWFRTLRFGKLTRFHKRNHRRAIVIDGVTGFTGGAAVADEWLGNAEDPDHWRDTMYRVTGCIAANLQSAFAQLWSSCCGEILIGDSFYPLDHPEDSPGEEIARHIHVNSSPADDAHPLRKVFWISLRAARETLYLATPYFVPDRHTAEVLKDRARAGVDVRLLLPGEHTDAQPIRWAAHGYYEGLLAAGVRIYEYQPTFIHAKLLVIDGLWSVVGSANIDIRSKELNQENVLGILDREFGAQLERTFLHDLERAREIRLEEWCRRGPGQCLIERFCLLFAEQY